MKPTKILMAAGGTGGHITPALATAQELKRLDEAIEVVFVGAESVGDRALWGAAAVRVAAVPRAPWPSRWSWSALAFPWRLVSSAVRSGAILLREEPDIVVGFGGYAAGPIVGLAALQGIPTLVHEQNVVPGRANRWLARVVDRVAVSFPETRRRLSAADIVCTGNPVRPELWQARRPAALDRFELDANRCTLLVIGGSQGARALNRLMVQAVTQLSEALRRRVQIVHLAGAADLRFVQTAYAAAGVPARVFPFLYRMAEAYAAADLVVARAGASTVAEATCLGLPMIVIPYPHAGGHQRFNAETMAQAGAAIVLEQEGLTGARLAEEIARWVDDPSARRQMAEASRRIGQPDAARRLAEEILRLVGHGNGTTPRGTHGDDGAGVTAIGDACERSERSERRECEVG